MACIHLQQLYQLCQEQRLRIGSSDLVRLVCHQCGEQDVCPSTLVEDPSDAKPRGEATRDPESISRTDDNAPDG